MRKPVLAGVTGVAVILLTVACGAGGESTSTSTPPASAKAEDVIRFGTLLPLTGPNAATGAADRKAFQMAVDELNASGGVLGRRVVLDVADGACDAQQAVAAAQQLVRLDVDVSVGAECSTALVPAIPVLRAAGISHIEPSANSTDLLKARYDGLFLLTGTAADEASTAVPWLPGIGAHRTAVVHDGTSYALTLAQSLQRSLAAAKRPAPMIVQISQGARTYAPAVRRILASKADSVFYTGYYAEAGLLVRDLRAARFSGPIVLGDGATSISMVDIAGQGAMNDVYFVTPPLAQTTKSAKTWLKQYTSYAGSEPEAFSMQAYMAVKIAAASVQRAGSTDREAVRKAIAETDAKGPYGAIGFDARGVDAATGFQLLLIENGRFQPVCPPTCH